MIRKNLVGLLKNNDENIADMILEYTKEECDICKKIFNNILLKEDEIIICKSCNIEILKKNIKFLLNKLILKIVLILGIIYFSIMIFLGIICPIILYKYYYDNSLETSIYLFITSLISGSILRTISFLFL